MPDSPRTLLRLPRTLAYATIRCTIAGALACSSQGSVTRTDASTDALVAHDSPLACESGPLTLCGSPCTGNGDCACPSTGAYYCSDQCPTGCEPFV